MCRAMHREWQASGLGKGWFITCLDLCARSMICLPLAWPTRTLSPVTCYVTLGERSHNAVRANLKVGHGYAGLYPGYAGYGYGLQESSTLFNPSENSVEPDRGGKRHIKPSMRQAKPIKCVRAGLSDIERARNSLNILSCKSYDRIIFPTTHAVPVFCPHQILLHRLTGILFECGTCFRIRLMSSLLLLLPCPSPAHFKLVPPVHKGHSPHVEDTFPSSCQAGNFGIWVVSSKLFFTRKARKLGFITLKLKSTKFQAFKLFKICLHASSLWLFQ
ncbi:hypothetical protein DFH08DRAFT_983421 [Mycena albidolilacea]|uniref:Uncharacterized protein n=1 Tax=Mycena albidolilacea TaxID=1033008 RepID=A0AAD7AVQ3_9AGAR|nr:hypothetical protein DFH08DRAFT_983421 [Mycena albidolilacea]